MATHSDDTYPGQALGLPQDGTGSIAKFGRRAFALVIDYALATLIASSFFGFDQWATPAEQGFALFAPMLVFAATNILFIPTLGGTPGHRLLGMRVIRGDHAWPGLWRPIIRTALLLVVIPAVIWNQDGRGLHDLAAGTVLVRS